MKKILWVCILVIGGLLVGLSWNHLPLIYLLNRTDLTLDIITLLAGLVALFIYFKQKDDEKKDIAKILFIEITNAENILKTAKVNLDNSLPSDFALSTKSMPTESWSKNKYLFVREFDRLEWDEITEFYNKAELFDQAVEHNKSLFRRNEEQIRINLDRMLAIFTQENPIDVSIIDTNLKEKKKWENFQKTIDKFYYQFMRGIFPNYFYRPDKPINDAKLYLSNINLQISSSTVCIKLKKLANIKN